MLTIKEIESGKSYACKFKCETMLNMDKLPVTSTDSKLSGPGVYESVGIIQTRDTDNNLVRLIDIQTKKKFVIPFSDIWDIDTIDWIED